MFYVNICSEQFFIFKRKGTNNLLYEQIFPFFFDCVEKLQYQIDKNYSIFVSFCYF